MYITQALNHTVNGSPNDTPSQEIFNSGDNSFFEQMLTASSMQQTGSITNPEMAMNKDMQKQKDESKADLITVNDEEETEEQATQYLGSPVSTTDMLSTIASFQRDSA